MARAQPRKAILSLQSSGYGGIERRTVLEVAALREIGWNVFVAAPKFAKREVWEREVIAAGGRFFPANPIAIIEHHQSSWFARLLVAPCVARLRRADFGYGHVPLPWTTIGLSRALALREAQIPYTLSLRCDYPKTRLEPQMRSLIKHSFETLVGAYAVSRTAMDAFSANFADILPNNFRCAVIPNGVDTSWFFVDHDRRRVARAALGLADNDFVVVSCGRVDPLKRPLLVLEGFIALQRRFASAVLLMVGDGPLQPEVVRRAAESGVGSRIRMIGFSSNVMQYLAAGDVFVSASASEGFGLSVAEALSASLPVVLSDIPAHREAFGSSIATRLVDSDKADDYAEALWRVSRAAQDAMAKMRCAARKFALDHFSYDRLRGALSAFHRDSADRNLGA